jgi:hypothetical protein
MANRTLFPGHVSFEGWWVRSSHGHAIGQLERVGRNLHTDNTYRIIYHDVCGNGEWTMESLLESGATITLTKPEKNNAPKPPTHQRRVIVRR